MNELPHHPADELASRWLDDDLTPDERAQAAADPEVQQRIEALTSVRAHLAAARVEPLPTDRADTALGAALAAFDDLQAPAAAGSVVPMHRRRQQRVLAWAGGLAAAAAVAVVAVGVGPRLGGEEDPGDFASGPAPASVDDGETLETLAAPESADDMGVTGDVMPGDVAAGDEPPMVPFEDAAPDVRAMLDVSAPDDLRLHLAWNPLPQPPTCSLAPGQSSHGLAVTDGRSVEVVFDVRDDTIRLLDLNSCSVITVVPRLP